MKQLLLSLLTFFLYIGCTENRIASKLGNTYPDIFPDYKGIRMNLIRKVYNTNLFLFILQQTLSTLILPTD